MKFWRRQLAETASQARVFLGQFLGYGLCGWFENEEPFERLGVERAMDAANVDATLSLRENSRRSGIARSTLRRKLEESGDSCRQYFLTDEQKVNIVELHRAGRSYREIAAAVECSIGSVFYHVHRPNAKYICECGLVIETQECVRCKALGRDCTHVRPWSG